MPAQAQNRTAFCHTDEHAAELEHNNPALAQLRANLDAQVAQILQQRASERNSPMRYVVPVVVHIVHQFGSENIEKQAVLNSLRVLNEDFARRNADTTQARAAFNAIASDMNIEFRLATIDPNGNPTDGITRVQSPYTEGQANIPRDSVKYSRAWPTNRYFNIWVVRSIFTDPSQQGTILGYAQFPYPQGGQTWRTWGIVMIAPEVTNSTGAGRSRTLTHEAGHCFNLLHTFQGGCTGGDQVSDTPPAARDTYTCNRSQNSCSNDSPNQPDMIENYMSYDACQNMFTRGQAARAGAVMTAVADIRTLTSAANLAATGVDSAGLANAQLGKPLADFGAASDQVCQGANVQILDGSWNGTIDNTWRFRYICPGTRNYIYEGVGVAGRNPVVVYDTAGVFPITLIVSNSVGSDTITRTVFRVNPAQGRVAGPIRQSFESGRLDDNADIFQNWRSEPATAAGYQITNAAATEGSQSIRIFNVSGTGGVIAGRDRYLYSPVLNLSGLSAPKIYFRRALSRRTLSATADRLTIEISGNCGLGWTTRGTRSMTTTPPLFSVSSTNTSRNWAPTASQWVQDSVVIGLAQRGNIQIRFNMQAGNASPLYLDDIQVGDRLATATAINRLVGGCTECLNLEVAPNPATGSAIIEAGSSRSAATLTVLDLSGRLLAQHTLAAGVQAQSLSSLAPGLASGTYILRLDAPEGRITKRLVVQQ